MLIPFMFLSAVLCFLLFISTFNVLRFRKQYSALCRKQILMDKQLSHLQGENETLKKTIDLNQSFSQDLSEADNRFAHLKLSQSSYVSSVADARVPEKYQYIGSLIKNGVKEKELAETCRLSREEVAQLLALARLNRSSHCY